MSFRRFNYKGMLITPNLSIDISAYKSIDILLLIIWGGDI
jgi:hypothetical protein